MEKEYKQQTTVSINAIFHHNVVHPRLFFTMLEALEYVVCIQQNHVIHDSRD